MTRCRLGVSVPWYAVLSVAGCAGQLVSLSPPASPRSLSCSLHELERLGYQVSQGAPGSAWYQAFRGSGGGGEEIWIRLMDDGRTAPWLDVRVTNWGQSWQGHRYDDSPGPAQVPQLAGRGQDDVRRVLDRCEKRVPEDGQNPAHPLP